jgi:excisionase family DNA binding protein
VTDIRRYEQPRHPYARPAPLRPVPARPESEEKKLTVAQAAKIIGISKMSIYRLCQDDVLPHYRVGRQIRVLASGVERFLADAKRGGEE